MTLQNIEQPGVSRVRIEKKEKKEVENVPADRSTRATRVNAASRIGLRSGLKYDLCFGRTANVRFKIIERSDVRRTSNPPRQQQRRNELANETTTKKKNEKQHARERKFQREATRKRKVVAPLHYP